MANLTPTQLIGGGFQSSDGEVLANGYLDFQLSQDGTVVDVGSIAGGVTIRIQLDSNGNVASSASTPAAANQYAWANANISPVNTFYKVTGYTAEGQLAYGPNNQQIGAGATFNVGTWIPNQIIQWFPPVQVPELEVNGTPTQDQQLLNLTEGDNITIVDNGSGEVVITAGGLPAGTQMISGVPGGTGLDSEWDNYTLWSLAPGGKIIFPSTSWQIRLTCIGGTGVSLANAVMVACHPGQTTVLTSTPITFGGGQMPYKTPFSGATINNPFYLTSDVIEARIDQFHDYYFYIYLDTDGTGYNSNLVLYDSVGPSNGYTICTGLYIGHTGGNAVPAVSGTVGQCVSQGSAAFITNLLVG
jgi:hypothetical protein